MGEIIYFVCYTHDGYRVEILDISTLEQASVDISECKLGIAHPE